MLDLQPGIHLDEIGAPAAGNELHRASAHIADSRRGLPRGLVQRLAPLIVKRRGRRFLDHLLMAALQRAFALEQRDDPAVAVAKDLHLDMARPLDELFEKQPVVPESGGRLALRSGSGGFQLPRAPHHAHALAAAARDRLEQHRKADPLCLAREGLDILRLAMITGHDGHTGLFHQRFGGGFGAHGADRRGGRPHENQPGGLAGFREIRVLREETVAGMDGFRAAGLRGGDNPRRC